MSTRTRHNILAGTVLGILIAGKAGAEPIAVTAGSVETNLQLGLARVAIEGDDFYLRTGVDGFQSELRLCTPCEPTGPLSLSGSLQSTDIRGAEALVGGVIYEQISISNFSGTFTTGLATLTGADQVVTLPFLFTGTVSGFLTNPWEPAFTQALTGVGVASVRFQVLDTGVGGLVVSAQDLRYDFSSADPVPEPATVLLVSAGLALAARRKRATHWSAPRLDKRGNRW